MFSRSRGSRPARALTGGRARATALALAVIAVAAALTALTDSAGANRGHRTSGHGPSRLATRSVSVTTPARRPNVIFVLTDDLSLNLLRYMPQVQALEARGLSFENYFVSDSLCCPSRSSIFTGNFPHDTGVFTNAGADGGIGAFYAHDDETHTFNIALQQVGYRTAMMGKYLNGYLQGPSRSPVPDTYVPPGWNEWDVAGWGYPEFNYELNQDGRLHYYGHQPRDYLTDVLTKKGVRFVNRSLGMRQPFFLELATFAPHSPYTPAPRYAHAFPGLKAPHAPSFNQLPSDAPSWLAGHPPLGAGQRRRINHVFRRRVQSVQAVDDMLTRLERALVTHHALGNTYIVFSSDNGYHMGEHRLMPGKLTAFDTDIRVPLVIAGPGIPGGATTSAMSENVDLAKTFEAIGGTSTPSDGHSLRSLFSGRSPSNWRNAVLVEHHGPDLDPSVNPDAQTGVSGNPTSYSAMRTPNYVYVEYRDGERELYDLRSDPSELHNLAPWLSQSQADRLHQELTKLENCHSGPRCWAAAHVAPQP